MLREPEFNRSKLIKNNDIFSETHSFFQYHKSNFLNK